MLRRAIIRTTVRCEEGAVDKDEQQSTTSLQEESIDGYPLAQVENFGIWHLNISDAAELIALDMWFSGDFPDIAEPEDWEGSEHDPRLLALLKDHSELFQTRLLAAVDSGQLKVAWAKRNFDEQLIPDLTYVSWDDLVGWLDERGYSSGDILGDWYIMEALIAEKIADHAAYLRAAKKAGTFRRVIPTDLDMAHKAVAENQRLREQLENLRADRPAKVDRPLPMRQRRTLLTVIAALCKRVGLAPEGRGTARRIMEMTDKIGAHVDDETIAKLLAEIPDALDARMK